MNAQCHVLTGAQFTLWEASAVDTSIKLEAHENRLWCAPDTYVNSRRYQDVAGEHTHGLFLA